MTPNYRILITKMADELDQCHQLLMDDRRQRHPLADHARALLAQEAVGPSNKELLASVRHFYGDQTAADMGAEDDLRTARAVLARWGRPAAAPVPVSERLPEPGDCDVAGRCWMLGKIEGDWRLVSTINPGIPKLKYCFSHWLPFNALPLPAPEGGEVS